MDFKDLLLKGTRKVYRKLVKPTFELPICEFDREKANEYIYNILISDKPVMISRFGSTESGILMNYLSVHSKDHFLNLCKKYVMDDIGLPWWDKVNLEAMKNNSGVFPKKIEILEKFSEQYLKDIPEIDLLGSFNYAEKFMPLRNDVVYVHLECLYPFWVNKPWTLALEGKKVLVIHPFVKTIESQYARHDLLFEDKNVLPKFELKTIKAIQSVGNSSVPFKDWFEALQWMKDEIDKVDFDFCILGCGAYGLPLAAYIKRNGKKAIHIGGGSQLLFGIKGKRWDNNKYYWRNLPQLYTNYSSLYNEYWVRPSLDETPISASNVEGGCYW